MTNGREQDHAYHVERARTELDAAYRADSGDVAAAHLRLCALHMRRARETSPRPPAVKELEWLEGLAPLHEQVLLSA
jgi:hypothetical protein